MLEMVNYILRFIITMKHVIYGAILSAARGAGVEAKWKLNLMHFSLKIRHLVAPIFHFR